MAGVDATIQVAGIKDALAALNRIDKSARRELTRNYKRIVQSVVDDAQQAVPLGNPISGFGRSWTTKSGFQMLPWGLVQDTVKAGVSGKKVREFAGGLSNLATFYVRFSGPTAVLFDMSGKGAVPTPQGNQMVKALSTKFRPPSRVLWPAYERNAENVVGAVEELVDGLMQRVQKELN